MGLVCRRSIRSYFAKYIAPVVVLKTDEGKNDNDLVPKISENHVLSLVLNEHNTIYWYLGITNAQARECDYSEEGIRKVLQEHIKQDDKLVVLIKPAGDSIYQNSVDILNEMAVTGVQRFVLSEMDDFDKAILQNNLGLGDLKSS